MAGFYGADTEQLRGFGDRLQGGRSRLEELAGELASGIHSVEWIGSDADDFRQDFSGRVNGLFDTAGGLLDRFRNEAGDHAEEQDEASADDDGGLLGAIEDIFDAVFTDLVNFGNGVLAIVDGVMDVVGGIRGHRLVQAGLATLDDVARLSNGMRIFNGIAGPLSILGGINSLFFSDYDGLRGVIDRAFGAVSIFTGGVGLVSAIAGAAVFGPVGMAVVGALGIAAGAWAIGNVIYDNWVSISGADSDAADAVTGFIGDAASGVADFVGGLF